jgi:hypothetical protein
MWTSDIIRPECGSGYRRIAITSVNGAKGDYRNGAGGRGLPRFYWPVLIHPGIGAQRSCAFVRGNRFSDWRGNQALSNGLFAGQLARAPNGVGFLSRRSYRWLLIEPCSSHLFEHAFPLHLLLQDTKRLLNVVVADENLHCVALPCWRDGETPVGGPRDVANRVAAG